jgi:hypothetical protein
VTAREKRASPPYRAGFVAAGACLALSADVLIHWSRNEPGPTWMAALRGDELQTSLQRLVHSGPLALEVSGCVQPGLCLRDEAVRDGGTDSGLTGDTRAHCSGAAGVRICACRDAGPTSASDSTTVASAAGFRILTPFVVVRPCGLAEATPASWARNAVSNRLHSVLPRILLAALVLATTQLSGQPRCVVLWPPVPSPRSSLKGVGRWPR